MPSIADSLDHQSILEAPLEAGLENISQNQTITFTVYQKLILPLDGFVFWVRGDLVDPPLTPLTQTVKGSLHRSVNEAQDEDGTYGVNRIVFTSEEMVDQLNVVSPTTMMLGEIDGIRFSFNSMGTYKQAGIFHYLGNALYPFMASQIIDTTDQLDALEIVVSNSLPIWLTLDDIMPMWPSFLVDDNIVPPYASVHVMPDQTAAIQSVPLIDSNSSHWQLARDLVRITIYGLNNKQALAFQDLVIAYSIDTDNLGIMNMPIIRDAKRIQSELNVIAMGKVIEFEVSYYQSAIYDIARKYILSCVPTYNPHGGVLPSSVIVNEDGDALITEADQPIGAST